MQGSVYQLRRNNQVWHFSQHWRSFPLRYSMRELIWNSSYFYAFWSKNCYSVCEGRKSQCDHRDTLHLEHPPVVKLRLVLSEFSKIIFAIEAWNHEGIIKNDVLRTPEQSMWRHLPVCLLQACLCNGRKIISCVGGGGGALHCYVGHPHITQVLSCRYASVLFLRIYCQHLTKIWRIQTNAMHRAHVYTVQNYMSVQIR